MGFERLTNRLAKLWQFPLLLFSLCLFGYAAYLFIDPKPGPTIAQHIENARALVKQDRAEAAIEQLNALLEKSKLTAEIEGAIRIALGEALEAAQKRKRLNLAANHLQIIEQTKRGLSLGIAADASIHRRLAESYEALGRGGDAIAHYRQAMAMEPSQAMRWQRKVIDLQLVQEDYGAAAASIEEYLKHSELPNGERAWAMGEKAHILIDGGNYKDARQILTDALKLGAQEGTNQGVFNYWLGYCEWKLGNVPEAERLLRVARDLLRVQHPLDADAAYTLGRMKQEQKEYQAAKSFYAAVLQSHLDSRVAPSAKLNRGICRIALGEHEPGLSDLSDLTRYVKERQLLPPRLRGDVIAGLQEAMQLLALQANYQGALEVLAYEQDLQPQPGPDFFERLGRVYERRADQLESGMGEELAQEKARRELQARECRAKAGDAYTAVAKLLVVQDDTGHGEAMWKAAEQYERSADLPRVTSSLEAFIKERPEDSRTPDALLKLGQSYQAAGLFDKAIEAYRKNQLRYPKSLAASKSGVPLARAYVAKGPEFYGKAEEVLRAVVENNPQITPEAEEFRESLWELANLYHRTKQFELAIAKLEELVQRYPNDPRQGQLMFLMAGSYRASAMILNERITAAKSTAATQPTIDLAEATRARAHRLVRAKELYGRVIAYFRGGAAAGELDRLYLKLSHFYQADCMYDLGDYVEAIRLYGDAAFRYQDDVLALGAYMQIVNANVVLGRIEEARAATERAKWMLRRMPAEAFSDGSQGMSRSHWEQWLKWTGESGLWK